MDRLSVLVRRYRKLLITALILFVVFSVSGFFILPPLLKSYTTKLLSRASGREVTFESLRINPYALSVRVKGIVVRVPKVAEPRLSVKEVYLNFEAVSPFKRAIVLREVKLIEPYARVDRYEESVYSFSPAMERDEFRKLLDKLPVRFSISNIQIVRGSIDFWDKPKGKRHSVRDANLSIPFISNIPHQVETYIQPAFSAQINGTPYAVQGKTKPFADSVETAVDLNIDGLDIPFYLAYLPLQLDFKIREGYLDVKSKLSFMLQKDGTPAVTVSGEVYLKNLAIDDKNNQSVIKLPQLHLSIVSAEPLVSRFKLSKVSLQSPEVDVRREKDGSINLLSLVPSPKEAEKPARKGGKSAALAVEIDDITISRGKVRMTDMATPRPFKTTLDPVDLTVSRFSLAENSKAGLSLTVRTEAGEEISANGELSVKPLQAEGSLSATSVVLKKYAPYYNDYVLLDVADGRLDLATRYRFAWSEKEPAISLSGLSASIGRLRAHKAGEEEELLRVPVISVKETDFDLAKKELNIGSLSTEKGLLRVKRRQDGKIDILTLAPQTATQSRATKGTAEGEPRFWTVSLKEVSVGGYAVEMEDLTPGEPVRLSVTDLRFKGQDISTARKSKGKASLSLRLNKTGLVSASGTVGLDPPAADMRITLKNVEVAPLQAYAADRVKMTVRSGQFFASGNLKAALGEGGRLQASYTGEASLNDFSSVDKLTSDDFLSWKSLFLSGMKITHNPLRVDITDVSLTDFYVRFLINADGTVNLFEVLAPEQPPDSPRAAQTHAEAATKPDQEKPMTGVRVATVTLQGGRIDFTDRYVKPNYSASLLEAAGRISGLSSEKAARADIELRGKVDNYVPVEVTGKVNPFGPNLFLDLRARVTDLDLSRMTPYSGKYAGYAIEKGKLSLDVNYMIVDRKLDSQNRLFLDQFIFGERVESPEATKLPVGLAVALLKDRKGQINLDIPVAGSIDDPQFSVWRIVFKIILNLITKAATSPFALLGALVGGGGEELGYVEFEYGSSALAEPQQKKVEAVAKALSERPSLKLDIEGHVDKEKDRDALKQRFFQRKLQAQKLNEMLKKGVAAPAVDDITIEPAEYEKYLKAAYKAEKFPKPRNIIGLAKDLPPPEMEKLMFTHIQVTEDDLRLLASQRAMKVRDAVAGPGKVEPERVFVVESKSSSPEKRQNLRESRVDLKLK